MKTTSAADRWTGKYHHGVFILRAKWTTLGWVGFYRAGDGELGWLYLD